MPHPADGNIGLGGHFRNEGRALGREAFAPELDIGDPMIAPQDLGERTGEIAFVRLVVGIVDLDGDDDRRRCLAHASGLSPMVSLT